jgi:SAM-dependent methyltransferase
MNALTDTRPAAPEVTIDRQYGPWLAGRWVPAPRFVLRRDRVLAAAEGLPPGKVLEFGCGSGALLHEFAQRGHECVGVETSAQARAIASDMLGAFPSAKIVGDVTEAGPFEADLLIACEVLEHIEEDAAALAEWVSRLRPGGRMILTVPAHMRMWGVRDIWAGHVRRYSRQDLQRLADGTGLEVERIECNGFPLVNLTNFFANLSVRGKGLAGGSEGQTQATAASGVDRSLHLKLFGLQTSLPGRLILKAGCLLQRAFLGTDWGDCFVMVATRR